MADGLLRPVEFEGASQYRGAFCYELAGRSLHLIMDDGHEYLILFSDGSTLAWSQDSSAFHTEHYECLKADETIYFINVELQGMSHRMGASLILDDEQHLVTLAILHQGNNPQEPDLITQEFVFGAVKTDGQPLPKKRQGYTSDLVGKRIRWRYSPDFMITHVYYSPFYIRAAEIGGPDRPKPTPEQIAAARQHPYDEICAYIKIRKGFYLVSFIEQNMTRRGGIGNNMMLLIDTARLHDFGRSFGLARQKDGSIGTENYFFSAIGEWRESDGLVESEPDAYRV